MVVLIDTQIPKIQRTTTVIFLSQRDCIFPPPGELACTPNINHQTEKVRGGINRHSNTKNTTNNDSDIFNSKGLYIPPTNWHVLQA